jgi:hypothetical protein
MFEALYLLHSNGTILFKATGFKAVVIKITSVGSTGGIPLLKVSF